MTIAIWSASARHATTRRQHKTDKRGVKTMAKCLVITIKFAFWFRFYVYGLRFVSSITGTQPDPDKVKYWIRRAIVLTPAQVSKLKRSNDTTGTK
jgi:hypothetical protein